MRMKFPFPFSFPRQSGEAECLLKLSLAQLGCGVHGVLPHHTTPTEVPFFVPKLLHTTWKVKEMGHIAKLEVCNLKKVNY